MIFKIPDPVFAMMLSIVMALARMLVVALIWGWHQKQLLQQKRELLSHEYHERESSMDMWYPLVLIAVGVAPLFTPPP